MFWKSMLTIVVALSLSACATTGPRDLEDGPRRHLQPIPDAALARMEQKGVSASDPILVRIFKQESELEIWKGTDTGEYVLFETYPICRWSGRLGPKKREGDRQAPEGFYAVTSAMMNPASSFYLSFDLGFPNRLEQALGWTGSHLMVHGACSSRGCYAMTDEAMAEIFAIAREAHRGGQAAFQVQAFPFRMSASNMRAFAADPNIDFWRNLREGYDIFEATRRPLVVSACGGRYAFHARAADGRPLDPVAPCPELVHDLPDAVLDKVARNRAQDLRPLFGGASTPNARFVDGGMHPRFRAMLGRLGEEEMAARTSRTRVPVSRPYAVR